MAKDFANDFHQKRWEFAVRWHPYYKERINSTSHYPKLQQYYKNCIAALEIEFPQLKG